MASTSITSVEDIYASQLGVYIQMFNVAVVIPAHEISVVINDIADDVIRHTFDFVIPKIEEKVFIIYDVVLDIKNNLKEPLYDAKHETKKYITHVTERFDTVNSKQKGGKTRRHFVKKNNKCTKKNK